MNKVRNKDLIYCIKFILNPQNLKKNIIQIFYLFEIFKKCRTLSVSVVALNTNHI